MIIARTPLLLEGVKKAMKRWERAHGQLERVTKRGYRKLQRRVAGWEKRRPDETPEQHSRRLSEPGDVEGEFHQQIVSQPKMRRRLDKAQAREAKRREELERAEEKKRRKKLMRAPIFSLEPEPTTTRTPADVVKAAGRSMARRRTKKLVPRRRA